VSNCQFHFCHYVVNFYRIQTFILLAYRVRLKLNICAFFVPGGFVWFNICPRFVLHASLSWTLLCQFCFLRHAITCEKRVLVLTSIFIFTVVNAIEMFIRCHYLFEIFFLFCVVISLSDCQWICMWYLNGNPAVSRSLWYLNVIRYIFARVGCDCCNFGSTTFSDCWLFWWFLVISKLWPSLGQAFTVR